MPKIRDLGINVIPVTMRPPEVGGGGGDVKYWAAGDVGCHPTMDPCEPPSQEPCENTCNQNSCKPTPPPPCHPTNEPCVDVSECDPTDRCSGYKTRSSALPEDAVTQLRQQLHHQIAEQQSTM